MKWHKFSRSRADLTEHETDRGKRFKMQSFDGAEEYMGSLNMTLVLDGVVDEYSPGSTADCASYILTQMGQCAAAAYRNGNILS